MPIQITDATIHQINKAAQTKDDGSVTLNTRQESLPKDDVLGGLCQSLIDLYTRGANSNGTLGQDPIEHRFPVHLKAYVEGQTNFIPFTQEVLGILKTQMEKSFLSTGGYALFLDGGRSGLRRGGGNRLRFDRRQPEQHRIDA